MLPRLLNRMSKEEIVRGTTPLPGGFFYFYVSELDHNPLAPKAKARRPFLCRAVRLSAALRPSYEKHLEKTLRQLPLPTARSPNEKLVLRIPADWAEGKLVEDGSSQPLTTAESGSHAPQAPKRYSLICTGIAIMVILLVMGPLVTLLTSSATIRAQQAYERLLAPLGERADPSDADAVAELIRQLYCQEQMRARLNLEQVEELTVTLRTLQTWNPRCCQHPDVHLFSRYLVYSQSNSWEDCGGHALLAGNTRRYHTWAAIRRI